MGRWAVLCVALGLCAGLSEALVTPRGVHRSSRVAAWRLRDQWRGRFAAQGASQGGGQDPIDVEAEVQPLSGSGAGQSQQGSKAGDSKPGGFLEALQSQQASKAGDSKAGGFLQALLPRGPEDEEPPQPVQPDLRSLASLYGVVRHFGNGVFIWSILAETFGNKIPALVVVGKVLRQHLWTCFFVGCVFEILHKACKKDQMSDPSIKLMNVGVVCSGLIVAATNRGIPFLPIYLFVLPSALALRRYGVRNLPIRFDPKAFLGAGSGGGSFLANLYAVLALEAVASCITNANSLSMLRATVLWTLHLAARDDPERQLVTPRNYRLNDGLLYAGFALFPEGFMASPSLSLAIAAPIMTVIASSQGKSIWTRQERDAREAAKAKETAAA